jgi:sigma-E factor negative regulatory protein RseA
MNAQPPSPAHPADDQDPRLWLSALADGEASAQQRACDAWRHDAEARATWHTYHLIGDVLRSDELAQDPARDADFLAKLRLRLAEEPVVLAPQPVVPLALPTARRRHAWLAPAAVAAGFVVVAGVLVVARMGDGDAGVMLSRGTAPLTLVGNEGDAGARVVDNRLIRDARLDRYLEAHRGALGSSLAVPGGAMRNAEVIVPVPAER